MLKHKVVELLKTVLLSLLVMLEHSMHALAEVNNFAVFFG